MGKVIAGAGRAKLRARGISLHAGRAILDTASRPGPDGVSSLQLLRRRGYDHLNTAAATQRGAERNTAEKETLSFWPGGANFGWVQRGAIDLATASLGFSAGFYIAAKEDRKTRQTVGTIPIGRYSGGGGASAWGRGPGRGEALGAAGVYGGAATIAPIGAPAEDARDSFALKKRGRNHAHPGARIHYDPHPPAKAITPRACQAHPPGIHVHHRGPFVRRRGRVRPSSCHAARSFTFSPWVATATEARAT
eukprot:g6615.t1